MKLGFHHDIYELLENIGWKLFSDGVTVDIQEEVALEMFMTLEKSAEVVDDEEVPCLKFRLKNEEKVITYGEIRACSGSKIMHMKWCKLKMESLMNFGQK